MGIVNKLAKFLKRFVSHKLVYRIQDTTASGEIPNPTLLDH